MKLRNKKTGEIGTVKVEYQKFYVTTHRIYPYNTLTELFEEWEDYEEPKEYWYIDPMVCGVYFTKIKNDEDLCEFNKQIGNYFETKEEAEKAVEKLKAYKRLKDRGFKFDGYNACSVDYDIDEQYRKNISQDLDLLFGGEK